VKECFTAQLSYLGCVAIVTLFAETAVKVVIIVVAKQFIRPRLKKRFTVTTHVTLLRNKI